MKTRTFDRHPAPWRISAGLAIALVAIFTPVVACSSAPETDCNGHGGADSRVNAHTHCGGRN